MKIDTLKALSPLDGRYSNVNTHLRDILSEYGLIKYRIRVEIEWFIHLSKQKSIPELPSLSIKDKIYLTDLIENFSEKDAPRSCFSNALVLTSFGKCLICLRVQL